jgi:hypothetical protein
LFQYPFSGQRRNEGVNLCGYHHLRKWNKIVASFPGPTCINYCDSMGVVMEMYKARVAAMV